MLAWSSRVGSHDRTASSQQQPHPVTECDHLPLNLRQPIRAQLFSHQPIAAKLWDINIKNWTFVENFIKLLENKQPINILLLAIETNKCLFNTLFSRQWPKLSSEFELIDIEAFNSPKQFHKRKLSLELSLNAALLVALILDQLSYRSISSQYTLALLSFLSLIWLKGFPVLLDQWPLDYQYVFSLSQDRWKLGINIFVPLFSSLESGANS